MATKNFPLLKSNDLIAISTDTVIGLAALYNEANLVALNRLKKRPPQQKIAILVANFATLKKFLKNPELYHNWAQKYWPGAYTLITQNYAFRIPDDPFLVAFLKLNGPLYATSCNLSGEPPLNDFALIKKKFPHLNYYLNYSQGSQQASKIYDWDKKRWIR